MKIKNINRIMICGRPGSGKSTYAKTLSERLQLPLYHLDKIFFTHDWEKQDNEIFMQQQKDIIEKDQWIIDGNSSQSFELRYPRTDVILYFDMPRWLCFWRIFKRCITKDISIDDRAPNCPETVSWPLLVYTWNYDSRAYCRLLPLRVQYPNIPFIEVRSGKDLEQISKNLRP